MTTSSSIPSESILTPAALLDHWQGHRRLTRKMIEAFPEDQLFTYSIGGMRPFSMLALEMIGMTDPGIKGVLTGKWRKIDELDYYTDSYSPSTKKDLLRLWDQVTGKIEELWPKIAPERFQATELAFGEYEGPVYSFILYWIDNEIHHRGQGYVYLRSLGIEPPAFWDRD